MRSLSQNFEPLRIILCGACGKMGKSLFALTLNTNLKVVCGVDLSPCERPFPVYPSLCDVSEAADVVVDFSSRSDLALRVDLCAQRKLPLVLAVTGLSEQDNALLEKASRLIPILYSENFSIGIALLKTLSNYTAQILGPDCDVEIVERHHRHKKDAPSGTALALASEVQKGLRELRPLVYGRHGWKENSDKEIGIHSVRCGEIIGDHEISFALPNETLTLAHSAQSRAAFAHGALLAAQWIPKQPPKRYDFSDLFPSLF